MKKLFLASSFADVFDLFLDFAGNIQNKASRLFPQRAKSKRLGFMLMMQEMPSYNKVRSLMNLISRQQAFPKSRIN